MKRILGAGMLALLGLGLAQTTASADCFQVYRPCIKLPVPAIPIYLPKFTFFCESCNTHGCPCANGPWWNQFPGSAYGAPAGYTIAPYGAFNGSLYGGGFGSYAQPAGAAGGYGSYGQPAQAWGGYQQGGYYTSQTPYYWNNQ